MADHSLLSPWIRRFLLEHLIAERNLAHNTQQSYRDAFCLLLPFASKLCKKQVDALTVYDLSGDVIKGFLTALERVRRCTVGTRNQRLAAIHALGRFIGERSPEHVQWCGEIRNVPFKRCEKNSITYLEKEEIDALLEVPDRSTRLGHRDYALLLFLYNLGARASEAVHVAIEDLEWNPDGTGSVKLHGKGRKVRFCHGSPDRCSNKSARRTTNQCATPQIRTQYTILEHSVPSRIALASELFSAAF